MAQNAPEGTVIRMPDGSIKVKRGAEWLATGRLYVGPGPKLQPQEQKALATIRTEAEKAAGGIADLDRFSTLNRKQGTGGYLGLPGIRNVVGWVDPELSEMNAITDRLTPMQREPGSGAMSDRDVEMYKSSTVNAGRYGNANRNVGQRAKAGMMRQRDYAAFMDYFARVNGTLNGAQEAWDEYKIAEPIYDPDAGTIRQGRSWRNYFSIPEAPRGAPAPQARKPAAQAPRPADPRKLDDSYLRGKFKD